ncbi:MAG: sulfite reductase subunit A, partial [Burkholderiales bacterium]|nr:sulfite reductase subunit A [Burkholderiales bacterium]
MAGEHLALISVDGLQNLLDALKDEGFRLVGPTIREQAIVYDDIASVDDLPRGWGDEQSNGQYRLVRRKDQALFGFAVGASSWKRYLHRPVVKLWQAERKGHSWRIIPDLPSEEKLALIGVRSCELEAIKIQDQVLLNGSFVDSHYQAQRDSAFIVAVNCAVAGGTCFCVSMKTGPKVNTGYDLALTEIPGEQEQTVFVVAIGSERGQLLLAKLPHRRASKKECEQADSVSKRTAESMGREMRTDDLRDLLLRNLEHPQWNKVAERCLTCGNCTMVCPTCFCTTVEDTSDLSGAETSRTRRWDSCFTMDYSYIHGGSVRGSGGARYRQWLTHKLATWVDQFGTSGCVGCGQCITWCPVGIDITAEV